MTDTPAAPPADPWSMTADQIYSLTPSGRRRARRDGPRNSSAADGRSAGCVRTPAFS